MKQSCSCLGKWFIVHNIILTLATPFVLADMFRTLEGIQQSNPVHTGLYVGYLAYTIVIWVAPLYFAELLQTHDEDLCIAVNEFCPGTFNEEMGHNADTSNQDLQFTFHSRTEVNKSLSYLNNRKSGFLLGSFNFQFKISMLSVFLGLVSFVTRFLA